MYTLNSEDLVMLLEVGWSTNKQKEMKFCTFSPGYCKV
jgi:hypothetical protein